MKRQELHYFWLILFAISLFFAPIIPVAKAEQIDVGILQYLDGKFQQMAAEGDQCSPSNVESKNYVTCECAVTLNFPTAKKTIFNYCRPKADFSQPNSNNIATWYIDLFSMGDLPPDVVNDYWFANQPLLQSLNILNVSQWRTLLQDEVKLQLKGNCDLTRTNYDVLKGYFNASCKHIDKIEAPAPAKPTGCCCRIDEGASGAQSQMRCLNTAPVLSESAEAEMSQPVESCGARLFEDAVSSPNITYQELALPASGRCSDVFKQTVGGTASGQQESPDLRAQARGLNRLKFSTVQQFIGQGIKALTAFMGTLLLIMYVYAGLLWMLGRGNAEEIDKSKRIFIWSTLGAVVMLASYILVDTLFGLLK